MSAVPVPAPVPYDASLLLDLLAPGEPVTFMTFGEGSHRGNRALTQMLHGTLTEHWHTLATLNAHGAGIFWTVNATDCKGRKAENILRVRALFVDLDGAPIEPLRSAALPPHAIVESSPDRWHGYWRIADCPPGLFKHLQQALATRFGGDSQVCDLPRVMRLPGFTHRKGLPFLTRLEHVGAQAPYTLDEVQRAFEISSPVPYTETQETQVRGHGQAVTDSALEHFMPATTGQRNKFLFALARHLKASNPDATRTERRALVKRWHALALPKLGTTEFSESWGDFERAWNSVRVPEGAWLAKIMQDFEAEPLPTGLPGDYEHSTQLLLRVCIRLQRASGNESFYLSARTAAEVLGIHHTSAAAMLNGLVADGVLLLVRRGSFEDRTASEYVLTIANEQFEKPVLNAPHAD